MNSPATAQRYAYFPEHVMPRIQRCPDGEWVKWEDHCRVQAERDGAIEIAQMRTREIVKLREQRDEVVGLLRDLRGWISHGDHCLAECSDDEPCTCGASVRLARIDALVGRVGE